LEGFPLNAASVATSKPRAPKVPAKGATINVSDKTIEGLTEVFKSLSDKSRLKILLALAQAQDGEMHVSALCDLLGQSQPAVSHHLTLMRMNHLVGYRRDGKHNYYRIDSGFVSDLLEQFFTDSGNGHKQIQFDDFFLAFKRK
jgi:ArsR family transcriptional regulator